MEQQASGTLESRLPRRYQRLGFKLTGTIGLLISLLSLFWQICWNISTTPSTNWNLELEICFSLYGLFVASTSFYLSQIGAPCWAWYHIVISVIGILLDFILLGYHAYVINFEDNKRNDGVMISITLIQGFTNLLVIFLCRKIIQVNKKVIYQAEFDDEPAKESLLPK